MLSLPYDPKKLPRELKPYYISASEEDLQAMLKSVNKNALEEVFDHLHEDVFFERSPDLPSRMDYESLKQHLETIACKNKNKLSFIGDGLGVFKIPSVVKQISQIRELATSYTAYQGERSQGTLASLWIYQSLLFMLTGFEAINSSMYDRSTALFEAMRCVKRMMDKGNKILVLNSIFPDDFQCVKTLAQNSGIEIVGLELEEEGVFSVERIDKVLKNEKDLIGIVFPQVNTLGLLESVDLLTDLAHDYAIKVISLIDPILLGKGGLKKPTDFGKKGADVVVGEGQHLAMAPNFGGPGLGILGVRYHQKNKIDIRFMPGKYVGKAKDLQGNDAFTLVLSTREQHIRREKATSNICSNQAFIASLAGGAILARGEKGMEQASCFSHQNALMAFKTLTRFKGVSSFHSKSPFYHEFILKLSVNVKDLIKKATLENIWLGVDVSDRFPFLKGNFLKLSFSDLHTKDDLKTLFDFFLKHFDDAKQKESFKINPIDRHYLRQGEIGLPFVKEEEIMAYYQAIGKQNMSPEQSCYPLGSCTMKYNPYINEYTASLKDFQNSHPQAPLEDIQGSLEIIYHNQEYFKKITGLPAITTQPVAGAQGELVGLKLFLAYHLDKGEKRDILIIPRSAHGTNPATAAVVGFEKTAKESFDQGIAFVDVDLNGEIDFSQLKKIVKTYQKKICGMMITNPNTMGIFENRFKQIADLIHQVGGLVYMDGANMNAIACWVDLGKIGVDAVHNNTHKTWSIPHGGGGPGDAFVAVSHLLADYLPGKQIVKNKQGFYDFFTAEKSIGTFHRHFGNFAHKVRAYTYLRALGTQGIKKMSAVAVLSARYLQKKLNQTYPLLPKGADQVVRMHEFIITFSKKTFENILSVGFRKADIIARVGKLFLDFGFHAPTVSFPEPYGLMIEPTESYTKKELDRFIEALYEIKSILQNHPQILKTVPHFMPVFRINEIEANKHVIVSEPFTYFPKILKEKLPLSFIATQPLKNITSKILETHYILNQQPHILKKNFYR